MPTCGSGSRQTHIGWAMEPAGACELVSAPFGCSLGTRRSQVRETLTGERVFAEVWLLQRRSSSAPLEREKEEEFGHVGIGKRTRLATSATAEREKVE